MPVDYVGGITLGQAIPMADLANVQLAGAVNASLPDIQARIDGLLAVSVAPPPSLADLIASAQALLAALQALLAAPLPDVAATAAALGELQASLGQLSAALAFSADFGSLLSQAGIHYYLFAGQASELGTGIGSALSAGLPGGAGPSEHIAGAILLANDGGAINALRAVLRS